MSRENRGTVPEGHCHPPNGDPTMKVESAPDSLEYPYTLSKHFISSIHCVHQWGFLLKDNLKVARAQEKLELQIGFTF